ncbi:MAG: hypothetical protein FJ191_09590 [Gammaproteobacteria bacterium]|nr:hypothetical protein [Gammaproteobacteria bacterium]
MRPLLPVVATLALGALAGGAVAQPAARSYYLQEEVRVAKSQKFYLVLDLGAQALDLRLLGVTLRRFPLQATLLGQSRLQGAGNPVWPGLSFTLESEVEEPDRPVIHPPQAGQETTTVVGAGDAPGSGDGAAPAKPLSLAESLTAFRERTFAGIPPVYRLHFQPDLDLVIRGEPVATDWQSRLRRLRFRFDEGWSGFRHWLAREPVATRVTLFMTPDDAKRLYLVLDPAIPLLIAAAAAPQAATR